MMTLYKSLVRPILEYCCPLWSPIKKAEIKKLESIQKSFITKITGVSTNYDEALNQLGLYSLENRRIQYATLHIWKIVENIAPNIKTANGPAIVIQTAIDHRRGRTCKRSI